MFETQTVFLLCVGLINGATLPPGRELDPVVVSGSDVPFLVGCVECVTSLVAFSWGDQGWTQVPVQVDEKHYQDWYNIKNQECRFYGRNITELVFADPRTLSGADEDNALDADDEIVFMARHLGDRFTGADAPAGVVDTVMEELEIMEPLDNSTLGYIYLFLSDGSLDPGAGQNLVSYVFNLTETNSEGSNEYLDVYNFGSSMHGGELGMENKEDSHFQSKHYRRHFKENWNSDSLEIFAGNSTGEDIKAHQDFQFKVNNCGRCIDTFTHGATAFIANKVGPVRAIRSWVGANSGMITQRESLMYEQREDLTTFLRVHPIQGLMDYIVYKEDFPLTFYNCHNEAGIKVDGDSTEDEFNKNFCPWEFVTGRAGSLLRATQFKSDLGDSLGIPESEVPAAVLDNWFYDNRIPDSVEEDGVAVHPGNPKFHLCSGKLMDQKAAWGTHGFKVKDHMPGIPNTCPYRLSPHSQTPEDCPNLNEEKTLNTVAVTNNYYYLPPGLDVASAQSLHNDVTHPLYVKRN